VKFRGFAAGRLILYDGVKTKMHVVNLQPKAAPFIFFSVVITTLVGVVSALAPTFAIAVLAGVVAVGSLLLLVSRTVHGLTEVRYVRVLPIVLALTLISLIPIDVRDPTAAGLGTQAIFEFSLQAGALSLLLFTLVGNGTRIPKSPVLVLWSAVGVIALMSAFWAPNSQLAAMKAIQLIVLVLLIISAAVHFRDRHHAVRYLAWLTLSTFLGMALFQVVTSGAESLIMGYEFGRQRLTLLAIHPLILGGFTGALAIMLLVNRPRRWDWLAFGLLLGLTALTNARVPLVLVIFMVVGYVLLRVGSSAYMQRLAFITGFSLVTVVLLGLMTSANTPTDVFAAVNPEIETQDVRTLNGRIPLWQSIFARGQAQSDSELGALSGHGFASFRYFGLDEFDFGGDAHNAAIQVFFELGALGLVLWLSAIIACGYMVVRSGTSVREKLILLLPILYIMGVQMMEASLADSRSFLLLALLFYAHIGSDVLRQKPLNRASSVGEPSFRSQGSR
jgi:O-antigen ligase